MHLLLSADGIRDSPAGAWIILDKRGTAQIYIDADADADTGRCVWFRTLLTNWPPIYYYIESFYDPGCSLEHKGGRCLFSAPWAAALVCMCMSVCVRSPFFQ